MPKGIYKFIIEGKWSMKYDKCIICGTIEKKHKGKGLCGKCYSTAGSRKWRISHIEEEKNRHKKYFEENHEKCLEATRNWAKLNKKRETRNKKRWRKENPERYKAICKKYYFKNREKNREKVKIKGEKYHKRHKERIKENRKINHKKRFNTDIHYRIRHNISSLVGNKLKRHLSSKNGKSTFSFLPYTMNELKEHLEKQFEPWMNWNNWGVGNGYWNIDHIRPDCSFNYKSVEDKEFKRCWALDNLRPLDAIKNIQRNRK